MKKFDDVMSVSKEIENITASEAKEKVNDPNVQYIDVRDKEIAKQLNIQFQTTLVIYKNNEEVYRSLGELSKEKIYKAINSVI